MTKKEYCKKNKAIATWDGPHGWCSISIHGFEQTNGRTIVYFAENYSDVYTTYHARIIRKDSKQQEYFVGEYGGKIMLNKCIRI